MFTPAQSLLGGYLLHVASDTLLADCGRVFGVSNILYGCVYGDSATWRWSTLLGMASGVVLIKMIGIERWIPIPGQIETSLGTSVAGGWASEGGLERMLISGLLVGFGAKIANGCTSGHFLNGFSRLSARSLVAVSTFFPVAILTASFTSSASASTFFPSFPTTYTPDTILAFLSALFQAVRAGISGIIAEGFPAAVSASSTIAPKFEVMMPTKQELYAMLGLVMVLSTNRLALRSSLSVFQSPASQTRSQAPIFPFSTKDLPYVMAGVTFTTGLILSGMASPTKVLAFLRLPYFTGQPWSTWDPSLAMVFFGGVLPNAWSYRSIMADAKEAAKKDPAYRGKDLSKTAIIPKPAYKSEKWTLPTNPQKVTLRLVIGSAVFGVGWGLCGICPGPMIVQMGEMWTRAMTASHAMEVITSTAGLGLITFAGAVIAGLGLGAAV